MKNISLNYLDFEKNPNVINDLVKGHINENISDKIDWYIMVVDNSWLKEIDKLNQENCLIIYVPLDNQDGTISSLIEKYNLIENVEFKSLPLYLEGAIVIYSEQIQEK